MHPALPSDDIRDSKLPALSLSGQLRFTRSRRLLIGVEERAGSESADRAIQQLRLASLTTHPEYPFQGLSLAVPYAAETYNGLSSCELKLRAMP